MPKRNWYSSYHRHPRTTQELRANQDRNDPYIRNKRRNLPTWYDDVPVSKPQKSWKYLGRRKQYRENKDGFEWRTWYYNFQDNLERMVAHDIVKELEATGCYWDYISHSQAQPWHYLGVKWYGPDILWGR